MKHLTFCFFLALLLLPAFSDAQRSTTTYESLLQRSDQPNAYISHAVFPADEGAVVGVMFRLDYDLIPFLKIRPSFEGAPESAEYFAPLRMGLEIFEGRHRSSRRNNTSNQRSIFRSSYEDTIYVDSFDDTRSRLQHTQGVITTDMEPGSYNYELQLTRAQSVREQSSSRQNFQVAEYDTLSSASILILDDFDRSENSATATFLNYGDNVLYGTDYQLMFVLPGSGSDQEYSVRVNRVQPGSTSDTDTSATFETTINPGDISNGSNPQILRNDEDVQLSLDLTDEGTRFAVASIPNSEFENARYRLQITDENNKVLASKIVNSRWLDMPVSLLNLDVSIDMLRFIVSDEELDRLKQGSTSEKERKFREFWEERDPTPDTEYNELMTEYYERIDYAFRNFSSIQTPGYETDQGRAYILYGAPENIERRLPTDQPTREIWEYPNRTLVFEATSGFGDFKLISER